MTTTAPHGTWRSPITAAVAAAGAVRLGGVQVDGADVYWLEGRPAEGGRSVLVRRDGRGSVRDVTPAGFNVRSRAHEYGGGAFVVADGTVYFCNDGDQRIWRQDPGGAPVPLTPEGRARYADLVVDRSRSRLIAVREDHGGPGEPRAAIVALPLSGGVPQILVEGPDFLASPRLSPDGARLAWLSWNHPAMPWQSTILSLASIDGGRVTDARAIAGSDSESAVHPLFAPDGTLWFVSDRGGWWNLHRLRDGAVEVVAPIEAELGAAQWVFGQSTYAFAAPYTIVCAYQSAGTWHLGVVDVASGELTPVSSELTEIAWVHAAAGRAVFAAGSPREPMAIRSLDPKTGEITVLHRPSVAVCDEGYLSAPKPVSFPSAGGATAHGLYYSPRNADFTGPPGERPPLIVMSHGGPTAAANAALSLPLQFWTSRGFAVLDVNYRGSTGYGRAFRTALDGVWGIADVEDCIAGARFLAQQGLADGQRLLIRGGSAGGYTTLAALTFHDAFRAGASYYGVSDLEALARDTHKFESRYLEALIGPYPARRDLYVQRSPINHVDRLSCPVIFFQGLEDRVVPPDQAHRMVEALRGKGLPAPFVTFAGEQHGFRRAENIARALDEELAFYRGVLGLPAD